MTRKLKVIFYKLAAIVLVTQLITLLVFIETRMMSTGKAFLECGVSELGGRSIKALENLWTVDNWAF